VFAPTLGSIFPRLTPARKKRKQVGLVEPHGHFSEVRNFRNLDRKRESSGPLIRPKRLRLLTRFGRLRVAFGAPQLDLQRLFQAMRNQRL